MNNELMMWSAFAIRALSGSTLVLVFGLLSILLLRRHSAATKHLVGTSAIGALLLLPIFLVVLPSRELGWIDVDTFQPIAFRSEKTLVDDRTSEPIQYSVTIDDSSVAEKDCILPSTESTVCDEKSQAAVLNLGVPDDDRNDLQAALNFDENATGISYKPTLSSILSTTRISSALLGVYLFGVLIGLVRMTVDYRNIGRLCSEATSISDDRAWTAIRNVGRSLALNRIVECRVTDEIGVPMVGGIFQPVVLLPKSTRDWPADRLNAAFAHEMAHVSRHDILIQLLVRIVGVFYWPQPLVYLISNIMSNERETACDDLVIGHVASPTEYARHLLDVAAGLGTGVHQYQAALAMARCSRIEQRIECILSSARRRTIPAWRFKGGMTGKIDSGEVPTQLTILMIRILLGV